MKSFSYQPTVSDVETMLTTLTVMIEILPSIELDGFNQDAKQQCLHYAQSAIKHLENMDTLISFNELQSIFNSLIIADMINYKEIDVDEVSTKFCSDHVFEINKLLPIFEDFFDE